MSSGAVSTTALSLALLGLAIAATWFPIATRPPNARKSAWAWLLGASVICGLIAEIVTVSAAASLGVLLACSVGAQRPRLSVSAKTSFLLGACVIALALALHLIPGFHNPILIDSVRLSPDSAPLTQYGNYDKAAAGLIILTCFAPRVTSWRELRQVLAASWSIALTTGFIVAASALALGIVRFDPKCPQIAPLFLVVNLLFVCVAEEAFFRGVIQERILIALGTRPGSAVVAMASSAFLFGIAHLGGGLRYTGLAMIAGAGFAYAYGKTRRVEASILAHFCTNAMHFFAFSYPFLR